MAASAGLAAPSAAAPAAPAAVAVRTVLLLGLGRMGPPVAADADASPIVLIVAIVMDTPLRHKGARRPLAHRAHHRHCLVYFSFSPLPVFSRCRLPSGSRLISVASPGLQ
ncbi:hypothetical protein GCM10022403_038220 [Streptomyces coacervatus]|uniref:Secreted protein n=1 Tax=Streptomyces coacervatus TaxID=647381 RepID=A0ABP7HRD4_9ACTN